MKKKHPTETHARRVGRYAFQVAWAIKYNSKYGFDINKETDLNVQYQMFYLNISRLNLKCLKLPLNILLHYHP